MKYKYKLPPDLSKKASSFVEFANGGAQTTIVLKDGRVFHKALISNSTALIAMRGFNCIPFEISDIADIYQTDEDETPLKRDDWEFWDKWK